MNRYLHLVWILSDRVYVVGLVTIVYETFHLNTFSCSFLLPESTINIFYLSLDFSVSNLNLLDSLSSHHRFLARSLCFTLTLFVLILIVFHSDSVCFISISVVCNNQLIVFLHRRSLFLLRFLAVHLCVIYLDKSWSFSVCGTTLDIKRWS